MTDNGIGISPDALPDVFDMFTQLERPMPKPPRARAGRGSTFVVPPTRAEPSRLEELIASAGGLQ